MTVDSRPRPTGARADFKTLREIVQERLLDDILNARLKPGQKLVETELAQTYEVSRGPIREAMRALEGQGYVRFFASRGAVVSSLTKAQLREVYDIRAELDGLATRLAVAVISEPELTALEGLLQEMDRSGQAGDIDTWLRLNDQFHMTLYRASGSERLCGLIADLMGAIRPYVRLFLDLPGHLTDTHADHALILGAAKARDVARAELLTKEHLRRAADTLVELAAPDHPTAPEPSDPVITPERGR